LTGRQWLGKALGDQSQPGGAQSVGGVSHGDDLAGGEAVIIRKILCSAAR
jgi:hypothetical protein